MFFICEDKQVIKSNVRMTYAYQHIEDAESVCKAWSHETPREWEKDKPLPKHTVEEFYLVPAALFDFILKEHSK